MLLIGRRGFFGAVHDEHALHVINLQAAGEVVDHLLVVAVSGETLYLGDLRLNTSVETEDGYPLQSRLLDARAERGGFAIADDESFWVLIESNIVESLSNLLRALSELGCLFLI